MDAWIDWQKGHALLVAIHVKGACDEVSLCVALVARTGHQVYVRVDSSRSSSGPLKGVLAEIHHLAVLFLHFNSQIASVSNARLEGLSTFFFLERLSQGSALLDPLVDGFLDRHYQSDAIVLTLFGADFALHE